MKEKDGLNYVPRERTREGRLFEHAADSRVLIDHLSRLDSSTTSLTDKEIGSIHFVNIIDEKVQAPSKSGKQETSLNDYDTILYKRVTEKLMKENKV